MLFYFSATGNTEHVVEEIKTNGESVVLFLMQSKRERLILT